MTKNKKNKYVIALDGPQTANTHTTTNQKLAFAVGEMLGRAIDRSGTCGEGVSPLFRGGELSDN